MQIEQLGPYRIDRKIGRGGMGTVYQGTNVETGQPAAIKVLNPRLAVEEGFRERFETEIETLKKLKHPNIVRLYGFGEQDEHLYYAMELVEGTNIEDELHAGRRFNWRETTQLGIKLAKALKHAHDHGVIHRDLKPANLLLTGENDIKLADFGIARLFGNTRLTSDGGLIGTAEYMAPEQADGRPVTFHCDLYSLGGVLFAMLAGRPPFRGGSLPELLQYHRLSEPPRVSRFAADVPDELDQIIARLLSKDPHARATNALVVARQLAAMEHALSLPQTRVGEREGRSESSDEDVLARGDGNATRAADSLAAPRPGVPAVDGFSVDLAGAPAGLHKDREAKDAREIESESHGQRGGQSPFVSDHLAMVPAPQKGTVPSGSESQPGRSSGAANADSLRPDPTRTTAAAGLSHGEPVASAVSHRSDPAATAAGAISASVLAQDAPRAPVRAKPESVSRFTTVEEDEQRRTASESERGPVWAQIAALAASLAMILGLAFYLTRPPSADALYQRIEAVAADDKPERLLDAEDDIHRFLSRFPDDPRGAKLKSYQDEIELLHLERTVQRLPRQLATGKSVSPIQRDYVEAIGLAGTSPQRAIAKLQAILEVYGQSPGPPDATAQFLELTRRKLKQLEEQSQHEAPEYLAVIDAGLKEAERIRSTEPAKAQAIWSGIVELYGDKPWAAERVARAKAALSEAREVAKAGH
ncbi:MAG TPA: serine/threonine-protein kinase [Pirellulales bacterium]|jgi:serine/threonine-protein kinase|nr:serine/threonine-protein kinase [Pirellulales bacterium]